MSLQFQELFQSSSNVDFRYFMRKNIAAMLPRVSGSSGTECLDLTTATELESIMYKETPTLDEYLNQNTLRSRVEILLAGQGIEESDYRAKNLAKKRRLAAQPQMGSQPDESAPCPKTRRMENNGPEFTAEQIRDHLSGLRRSAPPESPSAEEKMVVSVCPLCGLGKLLLAPMPQYCSCCGIAVKCGVNYYCTAPPPPETPSEQHNFCCSCFKQSRSSIPTLGGKRIPKRMLFIAKNIQEVEESWVKCDSCEEWSHQICGLFSSLEDEYWCPKCRLKALETPGEDYTPGEDCQVFPTAKVLPQTVLGDYIQHRLSRRLSQEREERARVAGKSLDEVPGVEEVLVRVVMSVKKTIAVNKKLLSVVEDEDYPTEFQYTTKMIMLFQRIEGVDVCLFAMYAQEYGSDCRGPNHRYAYISYIDSAKYFRPNILSATGEALRTVVYHEVLISYLDFVKKRGFVTCYLWSCPPLKGDQYILNCHPENQKTPKSERLRLWYQKMVKKAAGEGIVVNSTTLYDRFFVPTGGPGWKITAARLPYLDGDYWPGVVESLLKDIEKENKECAKKGVKKVVTKTSLKILGLTNPSDATSVNVRLMLKLGQSIFSSREDFMVIDLQNVCAHCRKPILSGKRWLRFDTPNSYICQSCYDLSEDDHDSISKFEVVEDVPCDTKDEDDTLENDICENRHKFLRFCQEKQYQFDTLRRTKHSSMMILRHLRPVTGGAEFAQSKDERARGCATVVRKSDLVEILRHVSQCRPEEGCSFRECGALQSMFMHATKCDVQAGGGCLTCQKVWYTLYSHSEQCAELNCRIPYCKELKIKQVWQI